MHSLTAITNTERQDPCSRIGRMPAGVNKSAQGVRRRQDEEKPGSNRKKRAN